MFVNFHCSDDDRSYGRNIIQYYYLKMKLLVIIFLIKLFAHNKLFKYLYYI